MLMQLITGAFILPPTEVGFRNVDAFSGKGAIARGFKGRGHRVARLDIALDETDDINSPLGFLRHLVSIMRMQKGGLFSAAVVCSSFTLINRGTSGRSEECPMGNTSLGYIRFANQMVSRVCLLFMAALFCGGHVLLENPLGSIIHLHDRLAEFIRNWNVVQTYTSLGMFGSLSPKPTKLFSDDGWVTHLQRRFHRPTWMALLDQMGLTPESTTVSYNDGSNVRRFKGSSSLKKSQVYPSKFGRAVAREFDLRSQQYGLDKRRFEINYAPDPWDDAKLGEVEDYLCQLLTRKKVYELRHLLL